MSERSSNPFSPDFLRKDWQEEKHPRSPDGKFTDAGSMVGPAAPTTTFRIHIPKFKADLDDVMNGKVKEIDDMHTGSSSAVYAIHFEDGGKAVFKPDHLSPSPKQLGRNAFNGKEDVDPSVREAFAFELDNSFLGFGIVPPTVSREFDKIDQESTSERSIHLRDTKGSVQAWADGEVAKHAGGDEWDRARYSPEMEKLAAFDFIIGNTDRHGGNYLLADGGDRVVAIDNGLGFPNNTYTAELLSGPLDIMRRNLSMTPAKMDFKPISASIRQTARDVDIENLTARMRRVGFQSNTIDGVIDRIAMVRDSATWAELWDNYHEYGAQQALSAQALKEAVASANLKNVRFTPTSQRSNPGPTYNRGSSSGSGS